MGVRRVVTGIDSDGRSHIEMDSETPGHFEGARADFDELWRTDSTPVDILAPGDPGDAERMVLHPAPGGVCWRIVTYLPQGQHRDASIQQSLDYGGASESPDSPWHTTETVDFGIVLSGRMVLGLDEDEVELEAGDCVVQRGTRHAWYNRTDETAVMAFVLIDGEFRSSM